MKQRPHVSIWKRCPRTGRILGIRTRPNGLPVVLFPVVGLLALVWYLVRVVPKPSRAAYPCQRAVAPLAGGFLLWLGSLGASAFFAGEARARFRTARYATAGVALAVALFAVGWAAAGQARPASAVPAAYPPHQANAPLGTARGLAPGRVAWAHDPGVTDWDGTSTADGQRWYQHVDQASATGMLQWALLGYAGTATTAEAWNAIFRHFNGGAGYQAGEKIFVKINLTTSNSPSCADAAYNWTPSGCGAAWTSIGPSPQLMIVLLEQLVGTTGVAQSDITIGDPTGLWVNELYNPVFSRFPQVKYLDARGTLGRTASARSTTPLYWSTSEATGLGADFLLQAVVDAKYLINLSILKSHQEAGITAAVKNHFGSLSGGNSDPRKPTTTGYYNLHYRLPLATVKPAFGNRGLMAQYRPPVDINVHPAMGGKTLLFLVDAIYAGRGWNGVPSKWRVAPFCLEPDCGTGDQAWPASLFLSMDPVAIDSVAFDLLSLRTDWTEVLAAEGVQDYLHELALADAPPSGTVYDPERDGLPPPSQGAHEHWNSAPLKQYTRNLGTGTGIDLLYLTGDPTQEAAARRTGDAIVIDGSADAVWLAAKVNKLEQVVSGAGNRSGPDDISAAYRTLYDDANLYLLVDVIDERLVNDSPGWSDDDGITLYLDGDYSRGPALDGTNDFQLGFGWGDTAISAGTGSRPVPAGTDFAWGTAAAGYRLEVRLPLAGLGIPPGYGRMFGLEVRVNDDDGGGVRDTEMAWWAGPGTGDSVPAGFGAGRLEGPQRVRLAAAGDGTGVRLRWSHFAWNAAYEVHRANSPYFMPEATTLVAELAAPGGEHLDAPPPGTVYYLVRSTRSELAVGSNRAGRFEFDLAAP